MKRLAMLRKEKGLNQIGLGLELNVSQKMISSYENGKNQPSNEMLKKIALFFNTSVDYLIEFTDVRQPIDRLLQGELGMNEIELLNNYRLLSENDKLIANGMILGLKEKGLNS